MTTIERHQRLNIESNLVNPSPIQYESQKLESLGLLAGTIAHDFKNILTAILGNANLAAMCPDTNPAVRELVGEIESAAERGAEICRQLLAYAGRDRLVIEPIDLTRLTRDTEALLRMAVRRNARLTLELSGQHPPIMGDATQLRQILLNLVLNASDAIGDAEGEISIRTGVMGVTSDHLSGASRDKVGIWLGDQLSPGQYPYLQVSDTGCGMNTETLRQIFDPFFTTKTSGRGLGLAIVMGSMRSHGGGVMLHTRAGRGAKFTLIFPPAERHTVVIPAQQTRSEERRYHGRALVIDDEESVGTILGKMLEQLGFEVSVALDGKVALDLFRMQRGNYRCVFLDWTLIGQSGAETFSRLRRIRSDVPITLMSGYSADEISKQLGDPHGVKYMSKPFRRDAVLQVLGELLGAEKEI